MSGPVPSSLPRDGSGRTETERIESGTCLTCARSWEDQIPRERYDEVADVAVGIDDKIFVLTRAPSEILTFDPGGRLVDRWGADRLSARPHALTIAPDGSIWCADEGAHALRRFTQSGELVQTIGTPGSRSDTGYDDTIGPLYERIATIERPGGPFNRPTSIAIAPAGDLFVADGYGNCRIHQFAPDGTLRRSWGEPGSGPGQFRLPHAVVALGDGRLVVADRENERLQVFSDQGRCTDIWTDVQRPCALTGTDEGWLIVGELAWTPGERSWRRGAITAPHPARITVLDERGRVVDRLTGGPGEGDGGFLAPHGIAMDRRGHLYLAEVSGTYARLNRLDVPGRNIFQELVPRAGPEGPLAPIGQRP